MAEGASLFLENLELRNGQAPEFTGGGGAVVADGEGLTLLVGTTESRSVRCCCWLWRRD